MVLPLSQVSGSIYIYIIYIYTSFGLAGYFKPGVETGEQLYAFVGMNIIWTQFPQLLQVLLFFFMATVTEYVSLVSSKLQLQYIWSGVY